MHKYVILCLFVGHYITRNQQCIKDVSLLVCFGVSVPPSGQDIERQCLKLSLCNCWRLENSLETNHAMIIIINCLYTKVGVVSVQVSWSSTVDPGMVETFPD